MVIMTIQILIELKLRGYVLVWVNIITEILDKIIGAEIDAKPDCLIQRTAVCSTFL